MMESRIAFIKQMAASVHMRKAPGRPTIEELQAKLLPKWEAEEEKQRLSDEQAADRRYHKMREKEYRLRQSKLRIVERRRQGESYQKIARIHGLSIPTVVKYIKEMQNEKD